MHVESDFKFKEEAWKRIIMKLEQELSTTVQVYKTAEEVLSSVAGSGGGEVHLVTARPALFSGVWKKSSECTKFDLHEQSESEDKFTNISMKSVSQVSKYN